MNNSKLYTTRLGSGLGLINETRLLLEQWQPGMTTKDLGEMALQSGEFPNITARRLRNIVTECFAPRFLHKQKPPAEWLRRLNYKVSPALMSQLFLLFTVRANQILRDFITEVYWDRYGAGRKELNLDDSREFVAQANSNGKTTKFWSESMSKRVASYLLGACSDFDLLRSASQGIREITPPRLHTQTFIIIAYDLHLLGIADNSIIEHPDWKLFGLQIDDVLEEFKRANIHRFWIIQAGGGATSISWTYTSMEEVISVILETEF